MGYFQTVIGFFLDMISSIWFWVIILVVMCAGRLLILRANMLFPGILIEELNIEQKKKRDRTLLLGRVLIGVTLPFAMLFIIGIFIF